MPSAMTRFGGKLQVTRAHVERLMRAQQNARNAVARHKERVSEMVGTAVRTLEVGGSAFALGAARASLGPVSWMGIDLEWWVGLGAHGAAIFLDDDVAAHLRGFGDGAVAVAAYNLAQETLGGEGKAGVSGEGLADRDLG
jgi:hypothetical protein